MKVLIIGGGGREHALCWKIKQSPLVDKIYCAPGNGGTEKIAEHLNISAMDIDSLLEFAKSNEIDLTIVGPEQPLVKGIVNRFNDTGLRIFGADEKAAILEGSKSFTKDFSKRHNIPTAESETFSDKHSALNYVKEKGAPIVIKADGLAAGKGVVVATSIDEATDAINMIMEHRVFGDAGSKVIVEEFLTGQEASYLVFTDGENFIPLASSQDHKQVNDGDKGPNTGGMGAYSPTEVVSSEVEKRVIDEIIKPTISGMKAEGRTFKGILYAGLMVSGDTPKLIEYNVRFGDPEAQPLLMRMKSDIVPIFEACIDGNLNEHEIEWDDRTAVCVVMASGGYPGNFQKRYEISGIEQAEKKGDTVVFHAGTIYEDDKLVTNGGRVLGVTALGETKEAAIESAYEAVRSINFAQAHYRNDIGKREI
ncbi:phosphoribosylamine--glycine ligase [Thermodesulfobacteriota bacterium]